MPTTSCYYPNLPLREPLFTVTPQILITHADGTEAILRVDSFDIIFPAVQLEVLEPAEAAAPGATVPASEDGRIVIRGKVDDHTVTVTVNGQPVTDVFELGYFEYTYTLAGDGPETVTIAASKPNCVSVDLSFTVQPAH